MEDEEQNELLQTTDEEDDDDDNDDSSAESEDCLQLTKPNVQYSGLEKCLISSKSQVLLIMFVVLLSSTLLIIVLPMYLESLHVKSSMFVMTQFITLLSTVVLSGIASFIKMVDSKYTTVVFCKPPVNWKHLLKISVIYVLGGFMVLYSLDQKGVACHIEDPVKSIILVFSLVYYFLFCKQFMKLHSIFATTTIIVGLFISIDYGLCNKFRCRGLEYEHSKDDALSWSLQSHALWTIVYIAGLALFAGFYTLLERYLIPDQMSSVHSGKSSFLLTTVSCLVSSRDSNASMNSQVVSELMPSMNLKLKKRSAVHVAVWIQFFTWLLTTAFFWINFIPPIGKVSAGTEFLNITKNGFLCHFSTPVLFKHAKTDCGMLPLYAWFFLLAYVTYIVSSIHFLIICQSAVFVIAVTVAAVPLSTIWWSFVHMDTVNPGFLIWSPSLNGELICAVLGIPIIAAGLIFLCKWHFRDHEI